MTKKTLDFLLGIITINFNEKNFNRRHAKG